MRLHIVFLAAALAATLASPAFADALHGPGIGPGPSSRGYLRPHRPHVEGPMVVVEPGQRRDRCAEPRLGTSSAVSVDGETFAVPSRGADYCPR
jgi:hypothetical protein